MIGSSWSAARRALPALVAIGGMATACDYGPLTPDEEARLAVEGAPEAYEIEGDEGMVEDGDLSTSKGALIAFWGKPCAKGAYGWTSSPGDSDFYVEYSCPKGKQHKAYTSLAYAAALAASGKKLLVKQVGSTSGTIKYRITLGLSALEAAFGNEPGSWFLSTQAEMRYK